MADYCCPYTFAGVTINHAGETTDTLLIDEDGEIVGLDGAPIRAEIDDQGVSHGGIVFEKFFGARIIRFTGLVDIRSADPVNERTAYITAMNVYEAAVIAAFEGALNMASALAWTPTGGSARSISCTYGNQGGEIQFSGPMLPDERRFQFTLVAADPTIS